MLHHGDTLYEYNSILTMTKTVIAIYPFKPRFFVVELMTSEGEWTKADTIGIALHDASSGTCC